MHELSLSSAIVDTVVRHARDRRVTAVDLTVGALRQVVTESLEFYFEIVARGTVCEGSELRIRHVDARLRCRPCAYEWSIEVPHFRCPRCGGSEVEIAAGNEFQVESLDVVTEEAQCIGHR